MDEPLISSGKPLWKNAAGCVLLALLLPLLLPFALMAKLFERPITRSPAEVARYFRDVFEGAGDDGDWDDFVSIPIADTRLESLRERAAGLSLPISDDGVASLTALLAEAEALALADQA